jgi:hypothetical protein
VKLAEHNRVQLVCVPGHRAIGGNEIADQLARLRSERPFIGPEPAWGVTAGVAKKAIKDWTETTKKYWESITRLKDAKGFLQGPSAKS